MVYRTPNATTLEHAANHGPVEYASPQGEYAAKLTTAEKAVLPIADGSTLCLALAVGMPGGLAKAVADRITGGSLKGLPVLPAFHEAQRSDADSPGSALEDGRALLFHGPPGSQDGEAGNQ